MDKNTVRGLILMAVVFLAFLWLSPRNDNQQPAARQQEAEKAAAANPDNLQPFTQTEMDWLKKNVMASGSDVTLPDSTHGVRVADKTLQLTYASDSVYGTVRAGGKEYNLADVVAPAPRNMSVAEQAAALKALRDASATMGKYGRFAAFRTGTDSVLRLSNDVIDLQLSSRSGSITRAELKKYDTEYNADEKANTRRKVVLFEGKSNLFDFRLPLPQPVNTADLYFRPSQPNDSTVLFTLDLGSGAYWGIRYTLPKGDSYTVKIDIVQKGAAPIVQSNNRDLGIAWHQDVRRQEKGRMFEERNSALYYKFAGGSVENLSEAKDDDEERQAKIRWIGFKNQFFSCVLISPKPFNTADFSSRVLKGSDYLKSMDATAVVNDYDWNAEVPASFSLFLGPNLYPLLSSMDDTVNAGEDLSLTKLIPLGWSIFRWINTVVIIPVFNFLGGFISNYGIIILLLTIFIKLVLFPLTYKSYKSQAKMRILAPDIKAINDKYPGTENAMLRQQKTMALYSRAGASPMSGCLPLLLQMPILFAMFSFFPSCIELRGQSFLWAHDLSAPDAIISWSGNIPLVTEYFGNHISLFCLLMTAVNIIYTTINMQNQPSQMPGMKWMMYLMPVFFMIFFNNYAAGLSYYYFLSLLITIIQTYAFRKVIKEEDVRRTMAENAKKPRKKSGFMARLEEAQRQQQQMLKEQQARKNNNSKGRR